MIGEIDAKDDTYGPVPNTVTYTSTETVFANDSLSGSPVVPSEVTLSVGGNPVTDPVAFEDENGDPADGVKLNDDGTITVEEGTTPGEYTITYTICEIANPNNCDDATVTVRVTGLNSLSLLKVGEYIDGNNDQIASIGDSIKYTFIVVNTGEELLKDVAVDDSTLHITGLLVNPSTLLPGDTASVEFTYALTQQDIDNKGVYNIAVANGLDPTNTPVTATSKSPNPLTPSDPDYDPACPNCTFTGLPVGIFDLSLTQIVSPGQASVFTVGDTVRFTITVKNEGDLKATDIDVINYIPAGLILADNQNWQLTGSNATLINKISTIEAGDEYSLEIVFVVGDNATPSIKNTVEIQSATGGVDIDSTPNNQVETEDDISSVNITICLSKKCVGVKILKIK